MHASRIAQSDGLSWTRVNPDGLLKNRMAHPPRRRLTASKTAPPGGSGGVMVDVQVLLAGQTPISAVLAGAGWARFGLRQVCLRAGLREAVRAGHGPSSACQFLIEVPEGGQRGVYPTGKRVAGLSGHCNSPSSVLGAARWRAAQGL